MISDIRTSTGAENKDGEITCVLKFRVPRGSADLDRWFWFCKHHSDEYELYVFEDGLALKESVFSLPKGQTTLFGDDPDSGSSRIDIPDDELADYAEGSE